MLCQPARAWTPDMVKYLLANICLILKAERYYQWAAQSVLRHDNDQYLNSDHEEAQVEKQQLIVVRKTGDVSSIREANQSLLVWPYHSFRLLAVVYIYVSYTRIRAS